MLTTTTRVIKRTNQNHGTNLISKNDNGFNTPKADLIVVPDGLRPLIPRDLSEKLRTVYYPITASLSSQLHKDIFL